MTESNEGGWTKREGYEVPPPADTRKGLTTQVFDTTPVDFTKPPPPSVEQPKAEEEQPTIPEKEPVPQVEIDTQDYLALASSVEKTPEEEAPRIHLKVKWGPIKFNAHFDRVELQEAGEETQWLILANDVNRTPIPSWSPELNEEGQNILEIEFEGTTYKVSYFGQRLRWSEYELFIFLVMKPD